jgi:hypothetical protein
MVIVAPNNTIKLKVKGRLQDEVHPDIFICLKSVRFSAVLY